MSRRNDRSRQPLTISGHPYPVMRVASSDAFLFALERLLPGSASWRLATNHSDHRAVVADYIGDAFNGEKLGIAVYDIEYDQAVPSNIISFATIAHRWFRAGKEIEVVSDHDIASAFNLFLPIVRDACRDCGIRCRIVYPKPEKPKRLASGAAQELTSFVRLANLAVLHPFDWQRFYRFVRYCHAHHVSLGQGQLCAELVTRGVPQKLAEELALCYAHGRGVLACRFEWID